MEKTVLLGIILALTLLGCDKSPSAAPEDCVSPRNPYNDGGGHDAGFKWAAENGGNCNGNSDSFNEGCAEFVRQMNQYNECVANSRQ